MTLKKVDPRDELIARMVRILEDTQAYLSDDTSRPSHTDGARFHKGKCQCCETDILGDIQQILAEPLAVA